MSDDAIGKVAASCNSLSGSAITPIGILVVVGMAREARAARLLGRVVVGVDALARALGDGASGVLSFGLCGGLDPTLAPGDLVVGTHVFSGNRVLDVDPGWLARLTLGLPGAGRGGVAGSDTVVADSDAKAALRLETGAVAADMESHRAAEMAFAADVPFAILRAVSDGASDTLPMSARMGFRPDGRVDVGAVIRGLLLRPHELPALIRTARDASRAMAALADAANRLRADP